MKAILGFLAFVVIIIFIVVMVARGGNNNRPEIEPAPILSSASSSDAVFKIIESGPIVAEEDHFIIEISVSRWNRNIWILSGYERNVVASASFDNNEEAFNQFLSALDRAGYTSERRTRYESEAGHCPLNRRFVFESDQFGQSFRRWTTACKEKGNFNGNFSTTRTLFRDQIPEYSSFISSARRETGLAL